MSTKNYLYFSLAPVQGFVARARRTRDFWAGSFLLSYLAGHAMLTILNEGGRLIIPAVSEVNGNNIEIKDPLLKAIKQKMEGKTVEQGVHIASLPNRFQAEIPEDFDPDKCTGAIRTAWDELAKEVWAQYVEPVSYLGKDTHNIWKRQIEHFWEINWVIGEDPALLDRRKNWRSHVPSVEPGDKCHLFENLQELSGYVRSKERDNQKKFWEILRRRTGEHQLGENEYLSAVALVKRLFPLQAHKVLWPLPESYPSTPYLAALPWIRNALEKEPEKACSYAREAVKLPDVANNENPNTFSGLRKALERNPQAKAFASLDGNCFFAASLENPHLWRDREDTHNGVDFNILRKGIKEQLETFGSSPSPFYAMVLMDGDHVGKMLRKLQRIDSPEIMSQALAQFSYKVPEIVKEHGGITIFAGGDDVLALFPIEGSLEAVLALRSYYSTCFNLTELQSFPATISGAIVFAHYSITLKGVYQEAHRLLDVVAKKETGRDSLAVTVWKGAGRVLSWSLPWREIWKEGNKEDNNIINNLVQSFQQGKEGEKHKQKELNASFFYNLRSRFAMLTERGISTEEFSEKDMVELLAAEYIKSRSRKVKREEANKRMKLLLQICKCYGRESEENEHKSDGTLTFDGVLLVKFLVDNGVEA